MRKALRKADAIFDASGYTLGSGWPKQSGRILLDTIRLAKRYKKKIILMPQSFGPFNWGEADDSAFVDEVKKELTYPLKIYAREREGYDCLTSLGLNNVELSPDMVIRENLFPDANQIFAEKGDSTNEYPTRGSVGFIINKNVFRIGDPSAVFDLYAKILSKLIESGEKVYILNTSTADEDLVERVLGKVKDRQKVHMISGEYSSPELIDIIGRFKYVVASRYHSVVFAYRSGVPAVILGWARKYADLAALFQQQDYVFDIRSPNAAHILKGVEDMAANYESEAKRIKTGLEDVQASSVVLDALRRRAFCSGKPAVTRQRSVFIRCDQDFTPGFQIVEWDGPERHGWQTGGGSANPRRPGKFPGVSVIPPDDRVSATRDCPRLLGRSGPKPSGQESGHDVERWAHIMGNSSAGHCILYLKSRHCGRRAQAGIGPRPHRGGCDGSASA
ncbi:Polysaccharide pyruvyl transferase [Corchorus olitorius]|uniref:Polysaccharide pyruvyl transferase n=1 Tax=Corchorus olitorius TaxID=93759 RepID=A0A1R3L1X8_9ROSI|nr:Polysaccharide pyruvyl transferase [Corchorus olitorius]